MKKVVMDDSYIFYVDRMVLIYDAECRGRGNTDVCLDYIVTYPLSDTH
jgi:hypothetical protein